MTRGMWVGLLIAAFLAGAGIALMIVVPLVEAELRPATVTKFVYVPIACPR